MSLETRDTNQYDGEYRQRIEDAILKQPGFQIQEREQAISQILPLMLRNLVTRKYDFENPVDFLECVIYTKEAINADFEYVEDYESPDFLASTHACYRDSTGEIITMQERIHFTSRVINLIAEATFGNEPDKLIDVDTLLNCFELLDFAKSNIREEGFNSFQKVTLIQVETAYTPIHNKYKMQD